MSKEEFLELMAESGVSAAEADRLWQMFGGWLTFATMDEFERSLAAVCANEFLFPGGWLQ